jgi:hypothetical protein
MVEQAVPFRRIETIILNLALCKNGGFDMGFKNLRPTQPPQCFCYSA